MYFAAVWRANRTREGGFGAGEEGLSEREVEEKGDLAGGYRYQL